MTYDGYRLIHIVREDRILTATLDNPPINIITLELWAELTRLSLEVEADPDVLVMVMKSADPDFFLAHFDVGAILDFPIDQPASPEASRNNPYHAMCERFRSMDKVTIAQIEGRVGGGGSEIAMSFDMRFGVIGKTIVNQMEVPIGILPGGTGTQRMPRLIGRHRAIEIILGGVDLDAETAERWGYLNRALSAEAIGPHVEALARRIASFPAPAVRLAKQSIDCATKPLEVGLRDESYFFQCLLREESAQQNMKRFLEMGGQTRVGEMRVAELSAQVAGAAGPANPETAQPPRR